MKTVTSNLVNLPLAPHARRELYQSDQGRPGYLLKAEPRQLMRTFLRAASPGKRWAVQSLARAAGVSNRTVRKILSGESRPSLDTGLAIARAMQVSPWGLLEYCRHVWEVARRLDGRRGTFRVGQGMRKRAILQNPQEAPNA